jgi:predicted nucleic-acid-binding protein
MKSLDTNVLLRLLLADIPKQTAAVEALLTDTSQKFSVADMVFTEMVWALQGGVYGYDRQRIATNLRSIIAIKHINCNRTMLEKAIPQYVSHSKISFIDACLSVYAELNGATPLLTFDKKLATALPQAVQTLSI